MLNKIRSAYILKDLIKYLSEEVYLKISKYNKKLQEKLDLSITDYKKLSNQIVIEIIPGKISSKRNIFINMCGNKSLYHIYFNKGKEEVSRNYYLEEDNVIKIKVIIDEDKEMTSLDGLFKSCNCIKEITFIRFNRRNILNMNNMSNIVIH